MAQHDYNLINQSGASFRADLNNALAAIATNNSGTSEPSTAFAYEWWIDTSTGLLKIRNSANSAWITTGLNLTQSNTFNGNATTATTLQTARTINGVSFNGSANISFNTDSVSEGSSNLYFTNERVDDRVDDLLVAGTGISLTYDDGSNTLTIANTNDADITGVIAGNGLTGGGTSGNVTLNVDVDDSSIEIGSGALRVKNSGITNTMLAGSISNAKLSNSSVTINSQSLALGGSLDLDTSEIPESGNLYYTSARANTDFDTRLATKDTDNLAEGDNLYYTTARANTAIDSRVVKSFVDGLSVAATTAVTLLNSRDISLSGDVVGSISFNGSSNVDIVTTIQANSVALGNDTTGNYIQTITGTANKITVSGSGSETADVTLSLPDDVQIADSLTVAGNLTVNGTLTSLDTTNLDIEDNLFQLNAGLTGSPVNDSGMLINRGNQDNGIIMWDESVDKFTMGLTTADGSATGNITLSSLGTLVANVEGNLTGNVTGTVSSLSNHDTADLAEGSNLYYTSARANTDFDTRLATKDTGNLSEGSNLYYTDTRVQAVSINNVVEDTTPQLGGDLDLNSNDITGTGNINITGTATMDGLTVEGNSTYLASLNNTAQDARIQLSRGGTEFGQVSAGGNLMNLVASGSSTDMRFLTNSAERMRILSGGGIYMQSGYQFGWGSTANSIAGSTSTNSLAFYTNSSERMKINATGVGIGTSSPTSKISVVGGASDAGISIKSGGNAGVDPFRVTWTSGTEGDMFVVDDSGNVGIGTTADIATSSSSSSTGFWFSSSDYLAVARNQQRAAIFNRIGDDGEIVAFRRDGSTVGSIGVDFNTEFYMGGGGGGFYINSASIRPTTGGDAGTLSDNSHDLGSAAHRFKDLYLSGTANVGKAVVTGAVQSELQLYSSHPYSNNRNWSLITNHFGNGNWGGFSLERSTSTGGTPSEAMFGIDLAGNMGVGVGGLSGGEQPAAKLHIKQSANKSENDSHFRIEGSGYSGFHWLNGTAYYIGQNSNGRQLRMYSGSNEAVGVYLTNGGNSWASYSDERLKENITDIGSVTEKIKDIRCVTYNRKDVDDENKHETIGFIAQDFVGKFDQVLDESKVLDSDEETRYSIRYTETIPILMKAIQEQQELINNLTARIEQLEN